MTKPEHKMEITFKLPQYDANLFINALTEKGQHHLPPQFSRKHHKLYATAKSLYDLYIINEVVTSYLQTTNTKNPNVRLGKPARETINWNFKTLKFH